MTAKEHLKQYMLMKLRDMEEARQRAHRMPDLILASAYRYSISEDMADVIEDLAAHGIVETGKTLNDQYFRLNPENATE